MACYLRLLIFTSEEQGFGLLLLSFEELLSLGMYNAENALLLDWLPLCIMIASKPCFIRVSKSNAFRLVVIFSTCKLTKTNLFRQISYLRLRIFLIIALIYKLSQPFY